MTQRKAAFRVKSLKAAVIKDTGYHLAGISSFLHSQLCLWGLPVLVRFLRM